MTAALVLETGSQLATTLELVSPSLLAMTALTLAGRHSGPGFAARCARQMAKSYAPVALIIPAPGCWGQVIAAVWLAREGWRSHGGRRHARPRPGTAANLRQRFRTLAVRVNRWPSRPSGHPPGNGTSRAKAIPAPPIRRPPAR